MNVEEPWYCRQIPNGDNPLVVCERDALWDKLAEAQATIDRLTAELGAERRTALAWMNDYDRERKLADDLLELVAYVPSYETEPCRLDHHGYCQEHPGGFRDGGCYVAAAKAMVERVRVARPSAPTPTDTEPT